MLEWRDNQGGSVQFQAQLIEPEGSSGSKARPESKLPLIVHFSGVGSSGGIADVRVLQMRRLIRGPFVLVAPVRQRGMSWWVLSEDGDWGWVDANLMPCRVKLLTAWLRDLSCEPTVNGEWVSLLGYSAGAYAVSELCASGLLRFRSLVVGGIHGLGQPDDKNLDGRRLKKQVEITAKWNAYLERLSQHCGLPGGIFAAHHPSDSICPWSHAEVIFRTLSTRQEELGFPAVVLEEAVSAKTGRKRSKSVHNYSDQTFLRAEIWDKVLPYNADGSLIAEAISNHPACELQHLSSAAAGDMRGQGVIASTANAIHSRSLNHVITAIEPPSTGIVAVDTRKVVPLGRRAPVSCDIYRDGVPLSGAVGWAAGAIASARLAVAARSYRHAMAGVLQAHHGGELRDRSRCSRDRQHVV